MEGSNRRTCSNGEWTGQRPVCFGLNQENDYARTWFIHITIMLFYYRLYHEYLYIVEKPPTILFRHQLGPIAQSNEGRLVVYPGTILHMECLWIKRFGTPKWNVSHSFRYNTHNILVLYYNNNIMVVYCRWFIIVNA